MIDAFRHTLATALAGVAALAATGSAQDAAPKTSFTGDLGYVSASGNTTLTTLSLGERIVHTNGRWKLTQVGAYVYGKTGDSVSANQLRFSGRADFAIGPRFGAFLGVATERNKFAGFTSRTDELAGLAWKAIVAPGDSMSLDAGGVLTQQSDVDGTDHDDPSARFALNYKHAFSKTAYFQQLAEYLPNLKTSGAYRVSTESALVAPISVRIAIKLSYLVRYDSRPPVRFGTTDRMLTTGVQVSF